MRVLALDTESNGKDYRHDPEAQTIGVSLADSPSTGKYYPLYHEMGTNLDPSIALPEIQRRIDEADAIACHNLKHDELAMDNIGIDIRKKKRYCTMLMVHWINENLPNKGLNSASKHYGGQPKNKSDLMERFIKTMGWGSIPVPIMEPYAINDAEITQDLFWKVYPTWKAEGFEGYLWERELKFMNLLQRMEALGVEIDQDLCEREIVVGTKRMEEVKGLLHGLNPMSGKDLDFLLTQTLGIPVQKWTDKGNPSFDKEAMELYEQILELRNDPTAQLVLEYRGWQKTISSNYTSYLELQSFLGNVHPNFKMHGPVTTRLSCEKPNLQQIPRASAKRWNGRLKKAFRGRAGYRLYEADYANLELRLAAVYSQEPNLLGPLSQGFKPFDVMAEQLQWERQDCKTFTYATLYGGGVQRIRDLFNLSMDDAAAMRSEWFGTYPGLQESSKKAGRLAERRGYIKLWTDRRRHLSYREGYKAFNSLLQGGAAELVKSVMLALDEVIDWVECRMLIQVHDSVWFEIMEGTQDKWLPIIREVMENVRIHHQQFGSIPFPVDIKEVA